jgi:hypothetical protein
VTPGTTDGGVLESGEFPPRIARIFEFSGFSISFMSWWTDGSSTLPFPANISGHPPNEKLPAHPDPANSLIQKILSSA